MVNHNMVIGQIWQSAKKFALLRFKEPLEFTFLQLAQLPLSTEQFPQSLSKTAIL